MGLGCAAAVATPAHIAATTARNIKNKSPPPHELRFQSAASLVAYGRSRSMCPFQSQEVGLGLESSAETRELAGRADDAMTGRDNRDGISAVGSTDGPGGGWISDLPCDLSVRSRFSKWNGEECLPHFLLK